LNQEERDNIREFGLSSLSINNRTTVFVILTIIIIAGIGAYNSMPKAAFPDLVMPQIYVGTAYPGNSPADIEKLITRPIEKQINTISGVDKITSTSVQGYSTIMAEFDFETEPMEALRKVKDAVDKAKSNKEIPDDLPAEPNIFEVNFSEFPIMNINISGDFSIDQLKKYGEYLEDRIEPIADISKVDIRGVQEKEVSVSLDIHKMESMNISFGDVESAIAFENMSVSGGDILVDDLRRTVRVIGEFSSIEQLKNVVVKREKFNIVYLKEIADVAFDFEERESYAREFQNPVVMLDVIKRAGANLIETSILINNVIDDAKKTEFPGNLEISITNDQSDMTRSQVGNLENSIISGVILVVLVLLFFLGLRNALFVGVAIPLSMFMAFMILSAMGVTLNLMVLFSLILALGMLVDNGIVVVENIYRLMDEGFTPIQAAKKGVGEVALPIISSTATTLAAFISLAFWPGIMGEFMKFLPITLIIVLGSSLFVALVINPVLTSVWMSVGDLRPNRKKAVQYSLGFMGIAMLFYLARSFTIANLLMVVGLLVVINAYFLAPASSKFQKTFIPILDKSYHRFLGYVLRGRHPIMFFGGTIGLLILSFMLLWKFTPKVEFFPVNQPKYVNIFIENPIGTDIKATNEITMELEEVVVQMMAKYNDTIEVDGKEVVENFMVESLIAQVGEGTSDPKSGAAFGNTPHKARIQISFVEFQHRRGVNTGDLLLQFREKLKNNYPGTRITADKDAAGPPRGKPITIEVMGENYDTLILFADNMRRYINKKAIGGIEELKLDIELGKPELIVEIDRAKARRLNLSSGQIGSTIRTAIFGKEISKYKEGEDDYPINIRFKDTYRYNKETLMNQRITFRDQLTGKIRQVPISAVATARKTSTYSAVKRKNLNRVVTLSSNIEVGHNTNETVAAIQEAMKDYTLPAGYSFRFAGEKEDQAKEMAFLSRAMMIAVFLIFLIMVSQFNSAATPFIIVTSVVFSLIGVLMGLVIFQMDFIIIMTMIGIISLAGVVVNNAIVLLDYVNLLISRKLKSKIEETEDPNAKLTLEELKGCIIEGGKVRLRPVLLTAITTIFGLMPLATGMNINFFTLFSSFDPQLYFGGDNVIFWGPIAWTVIFGLTFATFLTLVIVPVMYFILSKVKYRISAQFVSA